MFLFAAEHEAMELIPALLDWKSNVINWVVLVGLMVWLAQKHLPAMFAQRERAIKESLEAAERAKIEAQEFLFQQKQRVANAEKEAAQILTEAKEAAEQMKLQLEEQTEKDMVDLQAKFETAIENERRVLVTEMRAAAARAAVELSEAYLQTAVDESVKSRLLNQFMEQLETVNSTGETLAAGNLSRSGERR